jgi:uncharacterized protein with PIN domain
MRCPNCGSEMNRHAEKPIHAAGPEESEVVVTTYYCPRCGKVEGVIEPLV